MTESCEILVCNLVLSHLNYGNSLLQGCTDIVLNTLQRIQNCTAKVVLHEPRQYNFMRALYELHLLPIHGHIEFKTLLIVYNCLTDANTPGYLHDLLVHINRKEMSSNLRSNENEHLVIIPYVKYKTFTARTFQVVGPKLWNKLPSRIKSSTTCEGFKKDLKTYLFTKYVINSMDTC